ncbi:MAG: helix-turn-helix domain-containing protein [Aliidongia sp.]
MVQLSQATLARLARHAARPSARLRVKQDWQPIAHALKRHVAHRLIVLRRSRGMTQSDMAALCGLSAQQFVKYERGIARFPSDKMWLVTLCFGFDISYFFDDFDPAEVTPRSKMPAPLPRDDNAAIRLRIATALARVTSSNKLQSLIDLIRTMADVPVGG